MGSKGKYSISPEYLCTDPTPTWYYHDRYATIVYQLPVHNLKSIANHSLSFLLMNLHPHRQVLSTLVIACQQPWKFLMISVIHCHFYCCTSAFIVILPISHCMTIVCTDVLNLLILSWAHCNCEHIDSVLITIISHIYRQITRYICYPLSCLVQQTVTGMI